MVGTGRTGRARGDALCAALAMLAMILACLVATVPASAAETHDTVPRIAVISAFPPEIKALLEHTKVERSLVINGVTYTLGTIGDEKVLLFASGISMVNATMTTQIALDRFTVRQIVFSGIAGGVDPALRVGDVMVAERWGQYLEAVFARETPDGFKLPGFFSKAFPNYGMIFPQPVEAFSAAHPEPKQKFWFDADPDLLARARSLVGKVKLQDCVGPGHCLPHRPEFVVGGSGVSGQAFVDNAAFRAYVQATFGARILDMETAAVAAVAYANGVPFIAFRSVSDLAGGEAGPNEMETFMGLASRNAAAAIEAFLSTDP